MALDAGLYTTDNVTVEYKDKISKISAVMVHIDNDKTGGAVSEMKYTTDIEFPTADAYWDKWSEWSTTEPGTDPAYKNNIQGVEREIEEATQYRNRDLLTKTSSLPYFSLMTFTAFSQCSGFVTSIENAMSPPIYFLACSNFS